MTSLETYVQVAGEQMCDALIDHNGWPEWFTLHTGWPDGVPAAFTTGSRFRQRVTIIGGSDTISWTVTELDPPHAFALEGTGTFGGGCRLAFELHPEGTGTQVRQLVQLSGPIPGPFKKRAAKVIAHEIEHSLRRLEARLLGRDPDTIAHTTPPGTPANLAPLLKLASRFAPGLNTTPMADEITRRTQHTSRPGKENR